MHSFCEVKRQSDALFLAPSQSQGSWFLFRGHVGQQLLAQYRQDLLIEQAVNVARPGVRQQAGGGQGVIQALVNLRGQVVVSVQALTDLCELHPDNCTHGFLRERTVNNSLETGE